MSRPLRLLALSTAVALTLTAAPVTAFADSSDASSDSLAGTSTRTPAPQPRGESRPTFPATTAAQPAVAVRATPAARTAARTDARAVGKQWPVRTRTGDATYHPVTPSGDLSQRFTRVVAVQDRLYGTLTATVVLQGTPTEATDSRLRTGFGVLRTVDGALTCAAVEGGTAPDVHSWVEGTTSTFRYRQPISAGRSTTAFNCMYALMISPDGTTLYDAVTDANLAEARQKPILGFKIPGKRLNRSGFTRFPIRILNSAATVATAPRVRLTIRSRGAAVRYNPRVGTIKPGQGKKGAFFIKKTRAGVVPVTFIVRSKDYQRKIVLKIRPVR